ncbi:MAG: PTS sugar transporter subunit IIA [Sporolactobacillus sp.]
MSFKEMFREELIYLSERALNETELFEKIASRLYCQGFVNKDYKDGLVKREENFPTGLMTQYLNIALPHSDTCFIEQPFICVVRIKDPITVKQMGDNQEIEVRNFLFLGIKDPSKQVGLLQFLMELFQDESFVSMFQSIDNEKSMFQLFEKKISEPEAV